MGGDPNTASPAIASIAAGGPPDAVRFADTARRLGAAAREEGLTVPAFRCPPRAPGVVRSVRRYPGGAVVSVRLRERPFPEVAADMVEGVVVVNRLAGEEAARARHVLRAAADLPDALPAALPSGEARVVERQTRAA